MIRQTARAGALLALVCCLSACGRQVVEFELPRGAVEAPTIVASFPLQGATVAVDSTISATFSQAMDPATVNVRSFTLVEGATPVLGSVTLDELTDVATFHPALPLLRGRAYTATVTTQARDVDDTAIAVDYTWSFTVAVFDVAELSVKTESVAAPDYTLELTTLALLTDAHDSVMAVQGSAELSAGQVLGQRYAIVDAAGLRTYAEVDSAFASATQLALSTQSIPAAAFSLHGVDLTTPTRRTLIVANIVSGVPSYQAFEITFDPGL